MYSAFDVNNVMRNIMKPNNVVPGKEGVTIMSKYCSLFYNFFIAAPPPPHRQTSHQSKHKGRWLSWTTLARLSCSVVSAMDTRQYQVAEAREVGLSLGGMRV